MRLWVGVTDPDWFAFLSRADVDEVNFWQPSARAPFVGLEPGAPFLFKLKRPFNHIAGGGWFVKFSTLPLSLAWEVFERKNGAASREAFEAMIRPLTRDPKARDPEIGCTVLAAPRRSQNWIGPGGASLSQATFVPPPVPEMTEALHDLETFLHEEGDLPVLVHCALVHAQFETIHPFLDGNGRVGRLLIAFQLVHPGVLYRSLLYISHYLKRHRAEYYDRLGAVRQDGGWEGWLRFFLRGVAETAEEATATAEAIVRLREEHRALLQEEGLGLNGLRLLDLLFRRPLVNVGLIRDELGVAFNTANKLAENLEALGLLEETTGGQRNRVFRYDPYWRLFEEPEAAVGEDVAPPTTESREQ